MKNFTKINKKIIALVMSLFILLSSLAVSPVYAAGKKYKLMYQDPFTAGGSIIKATSNVPGTDIAKGFSMAQSYIQNTSGDYIGRVYCLEMGNHPYAKNMEDTTSGVWQSFSYKQRIAIQDILALGLEGNMKGSYTDKKDFNNKNTYPVQNKARTNHWIYGNTEYGSGNFSDSEIYIATQLLIWEVTKGWRKTDSLQKTSKSLVSAYSNSHIKTVYNYISDRLYTVNQIPSFAVDDKNSPDINTYNFKVSYNNKSGTYSVNPSSKKLVSTNKNVLKHYTDLAKNKSIRFTNTVTGETKYLNIVATINGNSLTLSPHKTAPISNGALSGYDTDTLAGSKEKNLPSSGSSADANFIAYKPSDGEMANAQTQLGTQGSCKIDPMEAYFKISASFASTGVDRGFNIQKDMRIKSDTVENGVKADDSSLDTLNRGYYYYVKLPTTDGTNTFSVVVDGKIEQRTTESQNAATALGLKTSNICYNKDLNEYYVIMGPTNSDGVTGSIEAYMNRYVKSGVNASTVPYGNYYIYELGKADTGKGYSNSTALDGNKYSLDMNPTHYTIPDTVEPYFFSYEEHRAAIKGGYSAQAVRDGVNINYKGSADNARVEYYKRLKRVLRAKDSATDATPSFVNLLAIKVRIKKISADSLTKNIVFKIERKSGSNWVGVNLTDKLADGSRIDPWIYINQGEIATDSTGYTPYMYLSAGDYRITELGRVESSSYDPSTNTHYKNLGFRKYIIKPEPIEFSVGTNDTDIVDEYVANGEVEFTVENNANLHLRLFKQNEKNEPLDGAVYELYNSNMNLMTTLETETKTIDGVTYKGLAEIDGLEFAKYYVKEVQAPPGYIVDDTVYSVDFMEGVDFENGKYSDYKSLTLTDKQTETQITKTDITGTKEIAGARLRVMLGDTVIDEWTSGNTPHIIKGLTAGYNYMLTELTAPSGYATASNKPFTVNTDGTVTKVAIKDDTIKYAFLKVDEDNNPLSGATLQVFDEYNQLIDEWVTDGSEHLIEGKLIANKNYTLHEKTAPNEYYETADDITFKVTDTPVKQVITMVDKLYKGSVTIHKQDGFGNQLIGAEFELYTKEGTKMCAVKNSDGNYTVADDGDSTFVLDKDGILKIDGFLLGDYYLIETKPPEGKLPYSDKIEFTIASDSDKSLNPELVVTDDNVMLLNTGGNGVYAWYIGGLLLILMFVLGIIIQKRRNKNEK